MDIEETLDRETYRGFDIVHRSGDTPAGSRWQITHKESGMNRNYGFADSHDQARSIVDSLLADLRR